MEETSKGLQSNLLLKPGSVLRSDQVSQSFIQFGLEKLKGLRLHNLSGQPLLLLDCPQGEKALPYTHSKSLIATYTCCLSSSHHAALQRAWLHLPDDLSVSIGRLLLGSCKAVSSPTRTCPVPSAGPLRRRASSLQSNVIRL